MESFGNSHLMTPSQDPVEGVQTDTLHWNSGARQVVSASKADLQDVFWPVFCHLCKFCRVSF